MRSFITAMFATTLLTTAPSANAAGATVRRNSIPCATAQMQSRRRALPKTRGSSSNCEMPPTYRRKGRASRRSPRRRGLGLDGQRSITSRIHVLQVHSAGAGATANEMLARLRADPQVEYAVVDQRRHIQAVAPNDPLYGEQWYLQAVSAAAPAALDATDAWSTTTGTSSVIIADIDTGVRPDHPDLANRLVPGYCFISDSFVANNATCPGPDDVRSGRLGHQCGHQRPSSASVGANPRPTVRGTARASPASPALRATTPSESQGSRGTRRSCPCARSANVAAPIPTSSRRCCGLPGSRSRSMVRTS